MCLPIGLSTGKSCFATRLSMMATVGCFRSSDQVKSRPANKGIASVLKKPGEMVAKVAALPAEELGLDVSDTVSFQPSPLGMERVENAADLIDGRFVMASRSCLRYI